MCITVKITRKQRDALSAVARRRGLHDIAPLVLEAIDVYLVERETDDVDSLLRLEGSVDDRQANKIRRRIAATRRD